MQWLQSNALYLWVGLIGSYVIISSYFIAKVFIKFGKNEIFWFFLLNFLYPFLLVYSLWHPDFKKRLTEKERKIIFILIIGLIILILAILIPAMINGDIADPAPNSYSVIESIYVNLTTPFDRFPDWLLLPLVVLVPFYYLFVAFWISSLMKNLGEARSWFYAILFFHILIVIYILLNKKYREKLTAKQRAQVVFCGIGYFICAIVAKTAIDV